MSQMRFCYDDMITDSTVITYNSEETLFPVENMGGEILAKKYRTKTGFIIKSGYNDVFQFAEGRTGSSTVVDFALSATTFTGSGLASAVQTAMRAGGMFSSQTVIYTGSTERFTITKASTATSMALRFANVDMSICEIMGYIKQDYAAASTFISAPTKGNQQWVELRKENLSGDVFILHKHNFSSGTVLKLRAQSTSTYFYGLNQYGSGHGIFQAYTNECGTPTDLTGAGWVDAAAGTAVLSSQSINGNLFTTLTSTGGSYARDYGFATDYFTNTQVLVHGIIRKLASDTAAAILFDEIGTGTKLHIVPDFSDQTISTPVGTLLDSNWIDDNTVEVWGLTAVFDITVATEVRGFITGVGLGGLYTEIMVIDDNSGIMFPFVDGTHAIDIINETFTLPDQCTIVWRGKPRFAFDTASNKFIWSWRIDGTHYIYLDYSAGGNNITVAWVDGGTLRTLSSYQFDDGSSLTDINQEMIIVLSFDGSSGSQTGSRLIIIPLSSGAVNEDATFSGTPDIKSSTFPTMSQGHFNSLNQADSEVVLTQVYEGLLVGAVTSEATLNAILATMAQTLNLDYKHTDYMKYLATSTTAGQFEQSITINADPDITLLDETLQGNVIQLSWTDIKKAYSEIGRAFLSPVFYPANHPDNKINWFKRKIKRRTRKTMAESGATYFDKKDPINMYTIIPDPLNEYYNPLIKTGYETFLETVGDFQSFYTILDSDLSNTVYGFLPGDTDYNRVRNTPIFNIPPLLIQEQK